MLIACIHGRGRLGCEGSELHVVVQNTRSSTKQTIQLEVNLINIGPSTSKSLFLHGRRKQAGRGETDILCHDRLALALAGQSQRARKRHACHGFLRRSDAAEVEALQGEVNGFAGGWFESRGVVEARGQDVLHGDVGLSLSSNADGCKSDVDHVEAVPVETFVDADGLERCHRDGDGDVVELDEDDLLARGGYKLDGSMLTFAFCCWRPMLAALATIAGTAKIVENFMMKMDEKSV